MEKEIIIKNLLNRATKSLKQNLKLEKINFKDSDLIFGWANNDLVRKNSFIKKKIRYADHQKWLKKKLLSKNSLIFKLLFNYIPVGQIRFDKKNNFYEIDYSIDEVFRNCGFGKIMIEKSIKKILKKEIIIRADVKHENRQSIKIFKSLKFVEIGSTTLKKRFELSSSSI